MKTLELRQRGRAFTLVEVLVVIVVVFLLATMLLPKLTPGSRKSKRTMCTMNLKQAGLAFRTWAGDNNGRYPMLVYTNVDGTPKFADATNMYRYFQVMSNELNNPRILICPVDKKRAGADDFGAKFGTPSVSYFVGLDADETMPAMPLSGDRNLIINNVAARSGLAIVKTEDSVGWSAAMHNMVGNVGLADGSVQQVSISGLQQLFLRSGTNTVRLVIP